MFPLIGTFYSIERTHQYVIFFPRIYHYISHCQCEASCNPVVCGCLLENFYIHPAREVALILLEFIIQVNLVFVHVNI